MSKSGGQRVAMAGLRYSLVSPGELAQAMQLIARIYHRTGYLEYPTVPVEWLSLFSSSCVTTLVAWFGHTLVGTVSVFRDSSAGLPMDDGFHKELNTLRGEHLRIAEVGKLVVDHDLVAQVGKESGAPISPIQISMNLFKHVFYHGEYVGLNRLIVAVEPKHEPMYKRIGFVPLGEPRFYAPPGEMKAVDMPMAVDIDRIRSMKERGERGNVVYAGWFRNPPDPAIFAE